MDYFIKADTKVALESILLQAEITKVSPEEKNEAGEVITPETTIVSDSFALDVIGQIFKETGAVIQGEEGFEYPELAPVPGFHANLRGELNSNQLSLLADYLIDKPANPARVWA